MRPLRLFYLPNETHEGDQVGPRKAFRLLADRGVFSSVKVYSYLVERLRFATQAEALQDLFAAADAFQPDLIFWQHLNRSYPVERDFLRRLKAIASMPRFVWHDPDPYGRFIKPIDRVMANAVAECDLAVLVGLGYIAADIRRAGAPRVMLAPHSYDDERFGQPWRPTFERRFDAVMIANLTCLKRIPFLFMPGGRRRKQLARAFHGAYGARFTVHGAGQGWDGEPYCRGPIGFDVQELVIREAWLSINWGQFDEIAMYSSDRLPISLAAGVPHITNHQRGYEHLFPEARGLYFAHSVGEALDIADMLLSLPRERLIEIGLQGAEYARTRLNATHVYTELMTAIRERLFTELHPPARAFERHAA